MNEDDDPLEDEWPFERRIEAAAGWLTFGDWHQAKAELDKITNLRALPETVFAERGFRTRESF